MQLTDVLASMRIEVAESQDEARGAVLVSDDWMQGRSAFGGLQAALAVEVMRAIVPATMPMRCVQTTFLAPVAGNVSVRATVLRRGKSTTHVEARIVDGDRPLCIVVALFGTARDSAVRIAPTQPPCDSEDARDVPYIAGLFPAFRQHFATRWLRGSLPFTGARDPNAVVEISLDDTGVVRDPHVLAIADVIPPLALSMLTTFVPGSSVTWMLEMLRERTDDLSPRGWRVDGEVTAGAGGYTSQTVMVWGPNGVPVALSRQTMMVFG